MKKLCLFFALTLLALALTAFSSFAGQADELSKYGQLVIRPTYLTTAPFRDGAVSSGEYGEPIRTLVYDPDDPSQYCAMSSALTDDDLKTVLPEKAVYYMGYDADYLYIAAEVTDRNFYNPHEGGTDVWDGDYLELDISFNLGGSVDEMLDRNRIAYGLSGAGNPFGYVATVPSYASYTVNAELSRYVIMRDDDTGVTTYEAALSWKEMSGQETTPEKAYFQFQLGVAHSDYAELSDYDAYLGCWRFAFRIPAGVAGDSARLGLHILEIDTGVFPAETEAPETDAPVTDKPETEPPIADDPVTETPETAAVTAAPETSAVTEAAAGDPGGKGDLLIPIIIAAAVIIIIIIAVTTVVALKKKK